MDYIYTKKSGSPQTILELYGKDELFSMMRAGHIEIKGYSVKNWIITDSGMKAAKLHNPKNNPSLFKKVFILLRRLNK